MAREELERAAHAMDWMTRNKGRYSKLVSMRAPGVVIKNEKRLWDKFVRTVRDAIAHGSVELNYKWEDSWRDVLEEYGRM